MDAFDRIEMLLKERGMSQADLSRASGISTGLISQWKKRMQSPSAEKLKLVADVFGVTVDYLMNGEKTETPPALTKKDERDIERKLSETLNALGGQDGLMFDGEPLDDMTRELLEASLRNSLEMAKKIAKQKYTPKKYRKD